MRTYVYIAGPYHSSAGYLAVDRHIAVAREWAAQLALASIPFFCPHLNSAHFEAITPGVPSRWWRDMDMQFVHGATAMLLLPGWHDSEGSCEESVVAERLGLPIYETHDFALLREWWHGTALSCGDTLGAAP